MIGDQLGWNFGWSFVFFGGGRGGGCRGKGNMDDNDRELGSHLFSNICGIGIPKVICKHTFR